MARGGDAGQAARRSRGARAASPARGSAFGKRGGGDKEVALGAPCERFPKAGKIEAQHGQGEHEEELEFGGWPGALALMVWSHCMPLYMWIALEFHGGSLFFGPAAWHDPAAWSDHLANDLLPKLAAAWPTAAAWAIYGTFFISQVLLFYVCPGVTVQGLPVPSEGNRRLVYHCNAFCSWIVTLMAVYALHTTGVFSMGVVGRMRGQLLVVAMIVADVIAVTIYLVSVYVLKTGYKVTGNHLYDFFMGTWLNPRIGSLDLKLWAEIKVSWVTFFLLVLSSAIEQYEKLGYLRLPPKP
jgi:delta24(24(1))-sterol reductase